MSAREWNVYTDGSCKAGPEQQRPGGWGYYAKPPRTDIVPLEGYGGEPDTHAKIMEYRAIAEALSALPEGARAIVHCDNQGLVQTLQNKLRDLRASQFVNVDPLVREDMRRLSDAIVERKLVVEFRWVRSHSGNAGNERADALAATGAREAKAALDSVEGSRAHSRDSRK
jgi:ribonuclease HI